MKKVIERIVESPGAPNENDLWLNGKTLKKFQNGEWVAISGGGSGSASSLSDMTDVDVSSPSDGDTLVYNATTHKWENGSGGGSGCDCLPPMIVEGTIDENYTFTPGSGAPTFAEAKEHMFAGGLLYFLATEDGEPLGVYLASMAIANEIIVIGPDEVLAWMDTVEPDMTISINSYGENYYYDSNFAYNFVELDEDEVEAANAVQVDVHKLDISTPDSYILTRNTDEHDPVLFRYVGNDYMILIVTKDVFESEDVQVPEGVITNDYNYVVVIGQQLT